MIQGQCGTLFSHLLSDLFHVIGLNSSEAFSMFIINITNLNLQNTNVNIAIKESLVLSLTPYILAVIS